MTKALNYIAYEMVFIKKHIHTHYLYVVQYAFCSIHAYFVILQSCPYRFLAQGYTVWQLWSVSVSSFLKPVEWLKPEWNHLLLFNTCISVSILNKSGEHILLHIDMRLCEGYCWAVSHCIILIKFQTLLFAWTAKVLKR